MDKDLKILRKEWGKLGDCPTLSKNEKREIKKTIRFSELEWEIVQKNAEILGLKISEYLRERSLNNDFKMGQNKEDYSTILDNQFYIISSLKRLSNFMRGGIFSAEEKEEFKRLVLPIIDKLSKDF